MESGPFSKSKRPILPCLNPGREQSPVAIHLSQLLIIPAAYVGIGLKKEGRYLVFASINNEGNYTVSSCSPTQELENGEKLKKLLNSLQENEANKSFKKDTSDAGAS